MIRLHLKKQICMEDGCMLDNMLIQVLCVLGGMFGLMMSFYLALCFIQWVSDVVDEKRWHVWMEWLRWQHGQQQVYVCRYQQPVQCMEFIWQYGEYMMSIKRMVWIGLIVGTIGIWCSIFTNGFFITLMWLVIVSCIIAIIIKITENNYI